MSSNINEYVGKTFSYMLGIQNILVAITVTGEVTFENSPMEVELKLVK